MPAGFARYSRISPFFNRVAEPVEIARMSTSMNAGAGAAGTVALLFTWNSRPLARWISWSPTEVVAPGVPRTRPADALRAGVAALRVFVPPGRKIAIHRSSAAPREVLGI